MKADSANPYYLMQRLAGTMHGGRQAAGSKLISKRLYLEDFLFLSRFIISHSTVRIFSISCESDKLTSTPFTPMDT